MAADRIRPGSRRQNRDISPLPILKNFLERPLFGLRVLTHRLSNLFGNTCTFGTLQVQALRALADKGPKH